MEFTAGGSPASPYHLPGPQPGQLSGQSMRVCASGQGLLWILVVLWGETPSLQPG